MFKKPLRLEDISDETFIRGLTQPAELNLDDEARFKSLGTIDDETLIRGLTNPSTLNLDDESRPGYSLSQMTEKIMSRQNEKRSGQTTRLIDPRTIKPLDAGTYNRMIASLDNL